MKLSTPPAPSQNMSIPCPTSQPPSNSRSNMSTEQQQQTNNHASSSSSSSSEISPPPPPTSPPYLKSAHQKLDRRLILWYSLVYLIMRIHVSNISNTAIINLEQGTGIKKQLGNLSSQQWAWVLSIFYYPYMFFEPVATLCLKRFGPRRWMVRIMVTWVRYKAETSFPPRLIMLVVRRLDVWA